ncbi:hypothetical protein HBH56_196690 [Parastagonospora nodorum]|uniref:Uncharacterized protein n=1 Tax=Phaeosphaeria nodorum (strain SN15 / ATCC MYA-4574 / FGSC 10173) TaxID=321614 RepID=A0A7U2F8D2_PHANO|nr:hypothetical protein HBH56_196690 [Parastagonospora nodorum]QRD00631.1 hypothetical protein JI435_091800 [Parastagonospora nodorum SN15]KAH3924967.1 hypothetical protein HBH54_186810 [Parastagonospora nodorum]KAH3953327.1 hypothetical protein HBH53_038940 [Parastagonospora nodorum]KAH3976375.1 hypothetical protein HBH52_119530 [Parastagonospora nodorum]
MRLEAYDLDITQPADRISYQPALTTCRPNLHGITRSARNHIRIRRNHLVHPPRAHCPSTTRNTAHGFPSPSAPIQRAESHSPPPIPLAVSIPLRTRSTTYVLHAHYHSHAIISVIIPSPRHDIRNPAPLPQNGPT